MWICLEKTICESQHSITEVLSSLTMNDKGVLLTREPCIATGLSTTDNYSKEGRTLTFPSYLWLLIFGEPFHHAPIAEDSLREVLEIGTGPGCLAEYVMPLRSQFPSPARHANFALGA